VLRFAGAEQHTHCQQWTPPTLDVCLVDQGIQLVQLALVQVAPCSAEQKRRGGRAAGGQTAALPCCLSLTTTAVSQ
jgi:hypothetical protein